MASLRRLAGRAALAAVAAIGTATASAADRLADETAVRIASPGVELSGLLFTPPDPQAGQLARGARRPAIVLLHGCGGLFDGRGALVARHRDWAERFAGWGFVTMLPDSFGPRGLRAICDLKERPVQAWRERTADAHAALGWLAARPDVDPAAVFVLGWSHGGSTVMGVVRRPGEGGRRFRAAIAFYPGCAPALAQRGYRPTMPLLILHGEADDWTPIGPCADLVGRLAGEGLDARLIAYPEAHHGFDAPGGRLRYLPDAANPSAASGRGAHTAPHPKAREKAIRDVEAFIRERLAR